MSEQAVRFDDADLEAARSTLARAVDGAATHVVTLTDEQVMILDGLDREQIVPLPWLDEQEGADRALVGKVALRALLSQGVVVPGPGRDDDEVSLEAVPDITGPMLLRRTAQAILSAERVTSIDRSWVVCYLHDDAGVLEEEVSTSGHHRFSVYPVAYLGERLSTYLDPIAAAARDGEPLRLSTAELEERGATMPELTEARAVTTVSAVRSGVPELVNVTVYAGPLGTFVLEGGDRASTGGAELTLTEVAADRVRALPVELVA
ncbi:hypothetical protein AAG589_06315 [Isoptericola sp. F-RaC21]|uniref:hypothetical protein n=1 Tax=Isoptericola sp. F-RaC21 TaxID=3141452 RepID=UPI00315B815F